jgi:hypothetical protein
MKFNFKPIILVSLLSLFFCKNENAKLNLLSEVKIEKHDYNSKNIPDFFNEVTNYHLESFKKLHQSDYEAFCSENSINNKDTNNSNIYFKLRILNDLLSSENASNYSTGKILKIPYMWHWINPNPRHSIVLKEKNTALNTIKPSVEFKNYKSFADIDRTPFLYLSELFSETEKYTSTSCKSFATFGWCSEREMAFNCLLDVMQFTSKVYTEGNHCWSEVLIDMKTNMNNKKSFVLKIDNTFHEFQLKEILSKDIASWKTNVGNSTQAKWYNTTAHSQKEKKKLLAFKPSEKGIIRIENAIIEFLNKQ